MENKIISTVYLNRQGALMGRMDTMRGPGSSLARY